MEPDRSLTPLGCACASLRRASRAVTQAYEEELRPFGIKPTQLTLLQVLRRYGEKTQGELAEFLAIDSTTLSRTLRPLEKEGWVEARHGEDRRHSHWNLTKKGEKEIERVRPAWQRAQDRLRARLGGPRFEALLTELATVAGAAAA
jgi:DNA-binding MarR family transcriptional regulator